MGWARSGRIPIILAVIAGGALWFCLAWTDRKLPVPGRSAGRPACDPSRVPEPDALRPPDPHRVADGESGRFCAVPRFRRSAAEWRIVVTAAFSRLTEPVEEFESHEQG